MPSITGRWYARVLPSTTTPITSLSGEIPASMAARMTGRSIGFEMFSWENDFHDQHVSPRLRHRDSAQLRSHVGPPNDVSDLGADPPVGIVIMTLDCL